MKRKKRLYREGKPFKQFEIGQVVAVPVAVCESQKARIVGVEWGPQNGKPKTDCSGWLYWLVEVTVPDLTELAKQKFAAGQVLLFPVRLERCYIDKGGSPWAAGEAELLKWAKG